MTQNLNNNKQSFFGIHRASLLIAAGILVVLAFVGHPVVTNNTSISKEVKAEKNDLKIGKNKVVSFNYTLTDDDGKVLDKSSQGQPLAYLHGYHNIISGLESHLKGKKVGYSDKVTIKPKDGYGERNENAVFKLKKEELQSIKFQKGDMLGLQTNQGPLQVVVKDISDDTVTLDANHPMAGKTLHFDVEIVDIRKATDQEIAQGKPQKK